MGFLSPIPAIILVLALTLLIAAPFSFLAGRRGGRWRGLPGWVGFWVFFAALLVCLSRAHHGISFPVLGLFMVAVLRQYFFVTPIRPGDRWAMLATYLSVPAVLWPTATPDPSGGYYFALPALLFLLIPVLLSVNDRREGWLDSLGRVFFGIFVFVFCAAHLGLMVHRPEGRLEFFGILALAADLPQRLAGRLGTGASLGRTLAGIAGGAALAAAIGHFVGPMATVFAPHGWISGILVALASAAGALVAKAIADDLDVNAAQAVVGRAAFLDRTIPAIYAAPVLYHYLRSVV
jgi:predicted CDP-diglyceride synthetase/phosphatidate cytidylyltransferase